MNWNISTEHFTLRLPDSSRDADALYQLLSNRDAVAHIPKAAMAVSAQAFDELRRIAIRFEARESACWLVEVKSHQLEAPQQLIARIGIQKISRMTDSAQLWWELAENANFSVLAEVMPALMSFCFDELQLHRLEMRIRTGSDRYANWLTQLGFSAEGCLPAQQEYEGQLVDLELYSFLASDR